VVAGCSNQLPQEDLGKLRHRMALLESAVEKAVADHSSST